MDYKGGKTPETARWDNFLITLANLCFCLILICGSSIARNGSLYVFNKTVIIKSASFKKKVTDNGDSKLITSEPGFKYSVQLRKSHAVERFIFPVMNNAWSL
jgi:hypothetical protein